MLAAALRRTAPQMRFTVQRCTFASDASRPGQGSSRNPPSPPSEQELELYKQVPHIQDAIRKKAEAKALEPFPGYAQGLAQGVLDRGKGPIFRELPLQERLMARRPEHCPLCSSHPITGILPHINELAETNVELLVKFVDSRGMIIPRKLTGTCAKHQRKLARAIKRARHLGFLAFTRGPDDLDNAGPPSFTETWREFGDIYAPVHRSSDVDQAIQATHESNPLVDEQTGLARQPWQLPGAGGRPEELPQSPQERLATPGQPINAHEAAYRPSTFHVMHQIMASYQPPQAMSGSMKGSVMLTVKNKPREPEFDEPLEDPIEKFGPGEYYAHEAEFFGKRAPALTRAELRYDDVIAQVIARAQERKAAGQAAPAAPAEQPHPNWMARIIEERRKLENALKVERVMKEQKVAADDLDFNSVVHEVTQRLQELDAEDATSGKLSALKGTFEATRYVEPKKRA